MATWKKVIVSGSAAELLNITASAANITTLNVTAGSGSFSGSFQGDGSGLTGVPATGIVLAPISGGLGIESFNYVGQASASVVLDTGSAHFTAGVRGKISTSNTTGNGGITSNYNSTTGAFSSSLTNPTTQIGNTQITLTQTSSIIDGLTLTAVVATGSFSGSFVGTTNLPDLTAGTGISTFTYDGATTATVEVSGAAQLTDNVITKWNDTDGKFVDSSLTDNGTVVSGASSIQLTGASSNLSGSFSGSFQGNGAGLTGVPATGIVLEPLTAGAGIVAFTYSGSAAQTVAISESGVTNAMLVNSTISIAPGTNGTGTTDPVSLGETLTINGTANEIDVNVGANALTIGLPSDVTISQDLTVSRDLVVSRNLTVQGTASFQNTTNLDVADRFILMASGSNTTGDGGIVIQQGTQGFGEAFGFDFAAPTRWGVTGSFDGSQASFTPDAFMAAVVVGTGIDPTAAPARYVAAGNIFVGTDANIYIYS
jgi:hypothetical protein